MVRTALIDADLIAYEASSAADCVDEGMERRGFDYVVDYIDTLIENITVSAECTDRLLFLTGTGNFRYDVATVKPYKGNRKEEDKPFYLPATRKLLESYGATVYDGMEADDALAIYAKDHDVESFVLCSRDKDLRMVPCYQYSWEVGLQPEWGVELIDKIGYLNFTLVDKVLKNGEPSKAIKKVSGTGLKWFYCQLITGDSTDNIAGLEGKGAALAKELLEDCNTEKELYQQVEGAYKARYGETYMERILEMGRLLWMHDTLDEDGNIILWEVPTWAEQ